MANPGGGRGRVARHLDELRRIATRRGWEFETSSDSVDLATRARRAAAEGVERLAVAGGDGSVHWALQGLAGGPTALAVLPMGSGNDIAATLGFEGGLERCAERAADAPTRRIDLGRLGERWFAGVAGAGFDGEVNRYANCRFRRLSGPPIYVLATLRVLASFRPPVLDVTTPTAEFSGGAYFAALANCPRYGGGMRIAPDASWFDGALDIVVVRAVSKLKLLTIFPRVFSGGHCRHPAVWMTRARRSAVDLRPALRAVRRRRIARRSAGADDVALRGRGGRSVGGVRVSLTDLAAVKVAQAAVLKRRAILWLLFSSVCFGAMAFAAKLATRDLSGAQVATVRFLFMLAPRRTVATPVARRGDLETRRPVALPRHLRRRCGASVLPGDREDSGGHRHVAQLHRAGLERRVRCLVPEGEGALESVPPALVAFLGVVFVMAGGAPSQLRGEGRWLLAGAASSILSGAAVTAIRAARRSESSWAIFASFSIFGLLASLPFAWGTWRPPTSREWFWLFLVGLTSVGAQLAMTHAYKWATNLEAGALAQLAVVIALVLGATLLDEPLTPMGVAGSVLAVGGVLLVVWIQSTPRAVE